MIFLLTFVAMQATKTHLIEIMGGKKELEYENEIAFLPFHVFFIMVWFSSWFDLPKMQAKKKI